MSTLVVYTGRGLVRELCRGFVRALSLGRDDRCVGVYCNIFYITNDLIDPSHTSSWPLLFFMADLYTQPLLTMGSDELFSPITTLTGPHNPPTLDELTPFSRNLLNIAFTLC